VYILPNFFSLFDDEFGFLLFFFCKFFKKLILIKELFTLFSLSSLSSFIFTSLTDINLSSLLLFLFISSSVKLSYNCSCILFNFFSFLLCKLFSFSSLISLIFSENSFTFFLISSFFSHSFVPIFAPNPPLSFSFLFIYFSLYSFKLLGL
jgi:hypothetical protein